MSWDNTFIVISTKGVVIKYGKGGLGLCRGGHEKISGAEGTGRGGHEKKIGAEGTGEGGPQKNLPKFQLGEERDGVFQFSGLKGKT